MKHTIILLMLLLCFVEVASAQINGRYMSSNDPNQDPAWQWYKSYASQGGLDMWYKKDKEATVKKIGPGIETPFFTSGHDLRTFADEKDMYPEDGWMLAYRDFGTPSSAPNVPFFILYNRYRGTLRVMFRNIDELAYSSIEAKLEFLSTKQTAAILAFSDDDAPFLDGYDKEVFQTFISKVSIYDGWGYADFNLFNFDPGLDRNVELRLTVNGADLSTVKVGGSLTLDQVMDSNVGTSQKGKGFAKAFNTGTKYFKETGKAIKGLKDIAKSQSDSDAWWVGTIKGITEFADFVPGVGKVLGAVSSLFFQDDKASPKPLNFKGALELDGSIKKLNEILGFDLKLNHNAPTSSEYYKPVQHIPWGVFSLVEKPLVGISSGYFEYPVDQRNGRSGFSLMNQLKYTFNDNAGLSLVSMRAAFTFENSEPTEFYNIAMVENAGFFNNYQNPSGLAIELKLRIKSVTRNTSRDIIVYRVYPIRTEYRSPRNMKTIVGNDFDLRNQPFPFWPGARIEHIVAKNRITAGGKFKIRYPSLDLRLVAGQEIVLAPGFEVVVDEYSDDFEFIAEVPDFRENETARTIGDSFADATLFISIEATSKEENAQLLASRNVTDRYTTKNNFVANNVPEVGTSSELSITCFPNAFSESLTVRTKLPSPTIVKVDVYDNQGSLVHTLISNRLVDQTFDTVWQPGKATKNGIYFVKVSTNAGVASQKVVLAR